MFPYKHTRSLHVLFSPWQAVAISGSSFSLKKIFHNLPAMTTSVEVFHDDPVSIIDDDDEIFAGSGSETEESSAENSVSEESSAESSISEESSAERSGSRRFGLIGGLARVEEGSEEHRLIVRGFAMGMGRSGKETSVVAIHKNSNPSLIGRARMESFRIFHDAVARKRGGDANVRFGWFGGSRNEIVDIVNHGFSRCGRPKSGGSGGGVGVHLSQGLLSIDSAMSTEPDEDGLRHVLLCRVILGKMEPVPDGSNQNYPSSDQFDSGVDNLVVPRRYIVWSAFMNSHIFPKYIISFRSPSLNSSPKKKPLNLVTRPTSPWMSFPILVSTLSKFLDISKMGSINKHYNDFRARKISRPQLIRRLRQIAGDELLTHVIKLHINK